MSLLGGIAAGAGLVSGLLGSRSKRRAAKRASKAQQKAIQGAINSQNQTFNDIRGYQSPYIDTGNTAQNRLLALLGLNDDTGSSDYGKYGRDFQMSDFEQDPGYAFRLSEGLKALDRQAAVRTGVVSGAALKAAQNYGQEAASQEYQNAFNRYQVNRENRLNPLYRLMGSGQDASNYLGNARLQTGTNIANLMTGKGEAKASGIIGQSDAKTEGYEAFANNLGSVIRGFRR